MRSVLFALSVLLIAGCASQNRPLQLISGAGPVYPETAKAEGLEGFVTLRYSVSAEGVVENISVVASEPAVVFDQAAITALKSWRFNPRREAGRAVASGPRESTITFRLGGADDYARFD